MMHKPSWWRTPRPGDWGPHGPSLLGLGFFGTILVLLAAAFWQWVVGALLVFALVYIVRGWRENHKRYGTWGVPKEHRTESFW